MVVASGDELKNLRAKREVSSLERKDAGEIKAKILRANIHKSDESRYACGN
jgi:hypothetical protein